MSDPRTVVPGTVDLDTARAHDLLEQLVAERRGARWCLFVDRDGVVNRRVVGGYVRSVAEFEPLPGALDALAVLRRWAPSVVVVTNQQGIATGHMTRAAVDAVHRHLSDELAARSAPLDAVVVCAHRVSDACPCRKPAPGLLDAWIDDHPDVDPGLSIMVGDQPSDVEAGRRAMAGHGGCRTIGIGPDVDDADLLFPSLTALADALLPHLERSPR